MSDAESARYTAEVRGVQFSDQDGGATQKKIENYLAGSLGGDKPTHTSDGFSARGVRFSPP
jgi:Tfp pilus assembly protein PilZ